MTEQDTDELILQRLADWLRQTRSEADALGEPYAGAPPLPPTTEPDEGLYRLVEEFTALRQEVKLQTKSSRGLEEQTQTLQSALEQALHALRSIEPKEAQAAFSAGKSLALALAELDEALDRGRQQTESVLAKLQADPINELSQRLAEFHARQSWLRRWLSAGYHRAVNAMLEKLPPPGERAALLAALVDGYRLVQKRLSQALQAEGIFRIDTVGQEVDPEQMIVLEVVEVDDQPAGLVHDEVRRGYTWKGRLLRYAEVRATRNPAQVFSSP
jgi:molecular chaperone GrpE